jgi:hypothetical protein
MPKAQPLLLDLYPNAAVAYSLRKLRSGYKKSNNLWTYSEEMQEGAWTKEGTSITSDVLIAPDGSLTADVAFETSTIAQSHSLRRLRVVTTGEEYTVSFWAKANGRDFINVRAATQMSTDGVTQPTSWVDLSTGTVLSNSGSFRVAPTITSVGNDWYFIQFGTIASTPGTFTNFQVLTSPDGINTNYIGDITKGVAIWGVQISLSSSVLPYEKTVVAPSNGNPIKVRRSVDNAEQDFGFDEINDTLTDWIGYNLWTFSEEWDNAAWTKSGLNTTATPPYVNVEVAPDGTTTADKIIENLISQGHLTSRQLLVTTGVTYNVSVYLKHGGRNARVESPLSNLATYTVDVDLLTGTLSNNTFLITPILQDVGNGWYRLSYQVTATNTQTRNVITISLLNPTGSPSPINYLGDGVSGVFIWGAQITATSLVRTYTKTVATANAGNGFVTTWYDQSTNGNNATQSTPANQAQIVLNGFLIRDALSKPTTTWTTDRYTLTNGINPNTKYLSIGVLNRTANSNVIIHIGVAGSISGINGQQTFLWSATTGNIRSDMSSVVNHGNETSTGAFITTSEKNASDLKTIYLNGIALPITATQAPSAGANINSFGQAGGNTTTCQYQEYIYWDLEQSANRVAIETLINDYYAIF